MTVGSGDPTLTFEYENSATYHELNLSNTASYLRLTSFAYRLKEFIKEQLITIPMGSRALVPAAAAPPPPPPVAQPPSPAALADDPGAMLAGLL